MMRTTIVRLAGAIALLCLAIFCPAYAMTDCAELTTRLGRLSSAPASDLRVAANGETFQKLYGACDHTDRFAGRPLPQFRGRPLKCSTDPNRVEFVRTYPDRTVVFRSKMAVDADGAPLTRGPNASPTDQAMTWLTYDAGSETRYVNAEELPFVVVPSSFGAAGISFQTSTGIRKGDLAAVFFQGRCSFGVVGDAGPYFRLGEASIRTHADLGNPQCATPSEHPCTKLKRGGMGQGIGAGVTFMIFPGTRPLPLLSQTAVTVADHAARKKVDDFLATYAGGPPNP